MPRNTITRIRAKGDPFPIGFALGRASAGFLERAPRSEQDRAMEAHWRGSDYLMSPDAIRSYGTARE
ncbi:MAG TPA: hypothetical protein VGX71_24960 [Pseudaminobacter sp.]|nr:hypothetical protein [Pseudaminobacter sp.]